MHIPQCSLPRKAARLLSSASITLFSHMFVIVREGASLALRTFVVVSVSMRLPCCQRCCLYCGLRAGFTFYTK